MLYDDFNLYNIIKKAILLDNKDYHKLQKNLIIIEKEISAISMKNIKKVINAL